MRLSLAVVGVTVLAGALVSCGGSRPQPTTTAPPPPPPPTTATQVTHPKPRPTPTNVGLAWPTYGADNRRLRAVAAPGVRPPFRRLWTFHGHALLEFPPVIGYGSIFEEAFDGDLYALDPANGHVRWRYVSHRCGWSSPALAEHLVFATFIGNYECHAARSGGELAAFSDKTGRTIWTREIGPTESSPLVENGTVYIGDQNGYVYAFGAHTGHLRWSFYTGAPVKASPTLAYGRIYIGNYAGQMYALNAATGRPFWQQGGYGEFYSTAAVDSGRVYVGSLDDRVYAFSAWSGALLWSHGTGGYVYASPAVSHGLVLVGSYDHTFYALDGGTGSVRWSYAVDAPISGAASVIDNLVYFSSFGHRTYALTLYGGRLRVKWPDGEYSPAVAGYGHLYLVGLGRIYAFAPR